MTWTALTEPTASWFPISIHDYVDDDYVDDDYVGSVLSTSWSDLTDNASTWTAPSGNQTTWASITDNTTIWS